jgi:hypothetical protein
MRSVMSMLLTVALDCMTGHHIIHTISGRDYRPARPALLVWHRDDDVTREREGSFLTAQRRAMI